jgi:hypothetical protein
MSKDSLISKDKYINGFKPRSIIYPNVFARYYDLEIKDAYEYLDNRAKTKQDIVPVIELHCPHCYHDLPNRYYNINGLLTANLKNVVCPFCNELFDVDINTNNCVYYEKR